MKHCDCKSMRKSLLSSTEGRFSHQVLAHDKSSEGSSSFQTHGPEFSEGLTPTPRARFSGELSSHLGNKHFGQIFTKAQHTEG